MSAVATSPTRSPSSAHPQKTLGGIPGKPRIFNGDVKRSDSNVSVLKISRQKGHILCPIKHLKNSS